MNLFQEFEERKIDYDEVRIGRRSVAWDKHMEDVDVSIIIPVHGRSQFNNIITDAFGRAADNSKLKITLTFVEHSNRPEHQDLCRRWVNYIWIPQEASQFNKCLCFNMGVIEGPKAKYYLFHDGDILVPENFFHMLFENMNGYDAVQAFSGQRLFHCSRDLTETILSGLFPIESLSINTIGVAPARAGAEGGSIFVKREMIEQGVVFPDYGFTQYSVEDSYFWRSLQVLGSVGFCNEPPIDCYHLWHEASFGRQTKSEDWARYYAFMAMNEEGRRHLLKLQSDHFKKYFNEQA